jgi:hypothetical protein
MGLDRRIGVLLLLCLLPALFLPKECSGQGPAEAPLRFRLSPTRNPSDAVQPEPGLPVDIRLIVGAFEPRVPARCSWVGPADDESVHSGGIALHAREPRHVAQLASDLAARKVAQESSTALVQAVLAQLAHNPADAARWRNIAHEHHGRRLMQVLVVSAYSLNQAQRHEDSILLFALALQTNPDHPAAQDALEFLGVSLQYANHLECAEAAHARALARSPERALPQLNMGLLKLHSQRETAAQMHLEKAIVLCCGQDDRSLQPLCPPALQVMR